MTYSCERLAYWYFRLNGFLTTENFVVHPDQGGGQRTDADLLAVRFNHRTENFSQPMQDDPRISESDRFVNVVIAEVKTGRCDLNGPWTKPAKQNMERVLSAIGCVDSMSRMAAAASLYERGAWRDERVSIRLFALGQDKSVLLVGGEQQITWTEVIQFCIDRFTAYKRQKSSVGQWSDDGLELQRLALKGDAAGIRGLFRLAVGGQIHV